MNKFFKPAYLLPFLACLAFFTYWLGAFYISHDLVWDELVSLKNFVFVDVITTVTHYPDVNNHLFFNLLNNFYCQLIGVDNIYDAMDIIEKIRIYPLLISLLSIVFVYKAGAKFFDSNAGFFAVIILMTSIPFLNFTMQLRGYTMSMAFMSMSIYYLWSFEKKATFLSGAMLLFSVFGLLYAIPSNIYFALSLAFIYSIQWFYTSYKNKGDESISFVKNWFLNNHFYILVIIGFGAALSFAAYLPILDDLMNERHLQQLKGKSFYGHTLTKIIPSVLFYILSYRFLLLIPFFFVTYQIYKAARNKHWTEREIKIFMLFLIVLFSFGISLLRGDKPHDRTFTPLLPVFALIFGIMTYLYFQSIKWFRDKGLLQFSILFIYSVSSFFFCNHLIQKELNKAMINGDKIYNMFYNFYQSEKYDITSLDLLIEEAQKTGYPILMAKEVDRVAEGEYLHKHNLKYFSTVWAKPSGADNEKGYEFAVLFEISNGKNEKVSYQRIAYPPNISENSAQFIPLFSFLYQNKIIDQENPRCYVLTFSPRWFEGMMKESELNLKYERLNSRPSYQNIYLLSND